jgi:hypothetical protein
MMGDKKFYLWTLTHVSLCDFVVIVDSLNKSRLKSVRFIIGEIDVFVTSDEFMKIIKINH